MKIKKSQVPFTEARQSLAAILDGVEKSGKPVTILRHGKPAAVIIPHEMYKQEFAGEKPFPLAGSVRVAPGVDIDATLAKAKQERIKLWEKRMRRFKRNRK